MAGAEPVPSFNHDIRPILSDNCFQCHGPDDKKRDSDLRLDTFEGAVADLGGYAAIVPGKPEQSELLKRIRSHDPDEHMPPVKAKKPALSQAQIDTFSRWIAAGAKYQPHWAFVPVEREAVPSDQHPVDYFIRKKLNERGLAVSPEADPHTLIRRFYLDIIGLLPPVERVDQFVAAYARDPEDAIGKLTDMLLADAHYGERWGRHWLDQARYADSDGYSVDAERQMWPYRDWVIAAFNKDMPFDQFTIDQIAGDLLPKAEKSQLVASAFHRNTLINLEGGSDPEQFRNEAAVDRVNTTSAVWLGLTLGCAQCHTHKFDPLTHHDYYSMFAFFNQGTDKNNSGATVKVTEGEFVSKSESAPEKDTPQNFTPSEWATLNYLTHTTDNEAQLRSVGNGALALEGKSSPNAVFTITATSALNEISALQLRVLTDKSLPDNGPGTAGNGNFVLTNVEVQVDGEPVKIAAAQASHSQSGYPVTDAIDRDKLSGWAINTGPGSPKGAMMNAEHEAQFIFDKPIPVAGKTITVTMRHDRNENYLVGKFALAVSATKPALTAPQPKRENATANLLVMQDLPAGKQRETFIHLRGDFLNLDKKTGPLTPGIPVIFPNKLPASREANPDRTDLARWLIDPENPLTARVTVNRIWMHYFGKGIVETENDFGTQGSLPTHPELLDWLASEFIRSGWSQKHIHRLIVTSKTYRQSSKAREDLALKDPLNSLLSRQNRLRVDAEIVRDAALSASGMLEEKIGGPSVYPPQPAGVYSFTQTSKSWKTSTGPDRYRRAMYTKFFRSAPYPTLTTFDSPNFVTTCTSRARSNTPLQSLTMANDEAMIELAHGLGDRIKDENPADGIQRGFQICYSRSPSEIEQKALIDYLALGATWNDVARVLINTDEFITRE